MKETKKEVNWKKIWDDFEDWMDEFDRSYCEACGHKDSIDPDWENQQEKIKELIDTQVKEFVL